jgi:hypothetical protein
MAKRKSHPRPKRKPVDHSGLASLELRADIEKYMQGNPLARLGWAETDYGDEVIRLINSRLGPSNNQLTGVVGQAIRPKKNLWSLSERMKHPVFEAQYRKAVKEGMDPDAIKTVMYSDLAPELFKPKPVEGETPQQTIRRKGFETLVHELMHKGLWKIRPEQDEHHAYIDSAYEYPKLDAASPPSAVLNAKAMHNLVQKALASVRKGKPNARVYADGLSGRAKFIVDSVTGVQEEAEEILANRGVPTTKEIIHAQDEPVDDVKMTPSHMIDILKRLTLPRLW